VRDMLDPPDAGADLLAFAAERRFHTVLADPPWRFQNRTGKVAPEHRRLDRYGTMPLDEIKALPVGSIATETAHLYLWTPNALIGDALGVMAAWGFTYKGMLVWHKVRKDGGSDGRGVGFWGLASRRPPRSTPWRTDGTPAAAPGLGSMLTVPLCSIGASRNRGARPAFG
jgi:hypothetical protein